MSNRRLLRLAAASLLLAVCTPLLAAHHHITADQARALLKSLNFQQGTINVPGAHARLELTRGFSYLDRTDARKVLEQLWDNPPDKSILGMIVHGTDARGLVDPDAYAVLITYSGDGYVSDSDAGDINYDTLLSKMQEATREANPQRRKQGYPELTLVGWAEPPHYDHASHKLYWAKDLQVDDGAHGDALNYNIRALGRHGYLSLNAIADMGHLQTVKAGMQKILPMVHFDPGSRYVDFDSKTDHVAAYGISALIAGTLAAKAGLFAKLFAVLLAAKKAILAGLAAAVAFFRKLFRRKKA